MSSDAVRSELLAVPGIASAEVDLEGAAPSGVRVQLAPGAEPRRVGAEVQRILATHGMRSRFPSNSPDEPPPVSPAPVLADPTSTEGRSIRPPPTAAPPIDVETTPASPPPPVSSPPLGSPLIESVSVEERAAGLTAAVLLGGGRRGERQFGFGDDELAPALVEAYATAAGMEIELLAAEWLDLQEGSVVTVVLRRPDATIGAGACVRRSGRAFAIAAATRAALEGG